jgi:CBS domain-containing protein
MNQNATSRVLAPALDFLRQHAPFDRMDSGHLEFLARHLKLGFYAKGDIITDPSQGVAEWFYVVKQGRVRGEAVGRPETAHEGVWELVPGECFPIGALVAHRPIHTVHRAVEDTFCLQLEAQRFDELRAMSAVFQDFCARRLAHLFEQALSSMRADLAQDIAQASSFSATLSSLCRRAPVSCARDTALRAALGVMRREGVGSIVITDTEDRPLGIFTLHDLLARVTLGLDLDGPIVQAMTPDPVSLPMHALAHEAALLMAEQGIGHLPIVDGGRLVGVVSERDLFALQRVGLVHLSRAIVSAPDIRTLARLARDVHHLMDHMLAQGATVAQLNQIVTLLNDHITRRVIALSLGEPDRPAPAFTWLAFGSEGRGEQTLKTDQDNGIAFSCPPGSAPDAVRAALLPVARRINEGLAACGFPLCLGNVMASNPDCCLSLDEWKKRFGDWMDAGTPDDLLKVSIFFDFRPLFGDEAPARELRAWIRERASMTPRFRQQLAANALLNQPPIGVIRDFLVPTAGEHAHTLDLKMRGAAPFVDAARVVALDHGLDETNTLGRLRAAAEAGVLDASEAAAWCDAYAYLQLLRMRANQHQWRAGEPLDNHLDPDSLNELDRRILKEAFRQARKLQTKLALDHQLYGRV